MSTALVFGGAGFIGRSTCRELAERGVTPVAADVSESPDDVESHIVDVTDSAAVSALVEQVKPDIVVQLAALLGIDTDEHPRRGVEVNVMGTQYVFDACVASGVQRVVFASSIAVYGDQTPWGEQTVTEADLGYPTILYGWHKQLNEATARHYKGLYGLDAVGLRISTVYGAGRERGMSAPINKLIEGAATGAGTCPFGPNTDSCLVHVDDVAIQLATLATAERPRELLYNAGGDYVTVAQLAEWIAEARPDATIELGPDDVRIPHVSRVDGSRFIEEFGFTPRSFRDWALDALTASARS